MEGVLGKMCELIDKFGLARVGNFFQINCRENGLVVLSFSSE